MLSDEAEAAEHVVMLGDSILDNRYYIARQYSDVTTK